jgi:uncharacterized repeat protein (TIGR02543 family)
MVIDVKRVVKRLISLTLAVIMIVALLPTLMPELVKEVEANPPAPPSGNVDQRIGQLRHMFPGDNSFFSGNGDACAGTFHASCTVNNCRLENAMRRIGYTVAQSQQFGDVWTCAAFARFAYWYVFGIVWNRSGINIPQNSIEVLPSQARAGDIFIWYQPTNERNMHWAVLLENNSVAANRRFFQSNRTEIGGKQTNRVCYNTTFTCSTRTSLRVIRANNYDAINTRTITFNAQGGTPTPPPRTVTFNRPLGILLPTPSKPGYSFGGWWTGVNGTGTRLTIITIITANMTVHARWTPVIENGIYYIENVRSAPHVMHVPNGGPANTPVRQWMIHDARHLRWQVTYLGNGNYRISTSYDTGLNLTVLGTNVGTLAQVTRETGNNAQWRIFLNTDGTFGIESVSASRLLANNSMNNDGATVLGGQFTNSDRWRFIRW